MKIHKSKKDILNGNVPEQIIIFTMPLVGSYLLQQAYQIVDSIVLGRYAGKVALAAIGSSNSVINVILNFITGISAGIMIVLAQNLGKGDRNKVKETIRTGMFIAFALGGVLTILITLFANTILKLTGTPDEAMYDALIYLRFYAFSFIPYLIVCIGNYAFRAMGENRSSILLTLIISITKIILDVLLTAILKMGIWGISISTLVAQLICAIVVLVIFGLTPDIYHYSILTFGFDKNELKSILKIGIPAAIQSMLFAISNLVVQAKINTYGTDTVAAFSAYNSVDNYYWCFANAIGSATITLTGQNYGHKNMKRVKEFTKHGLIINMIFTSIISVIVLIFRNDLLAMYTTDLNVLNIGSEMMKVVAISYDTYIFIEIISATLKGCGDATNSMIITLIGICAVRILYVLIFPFTNSIQIIYCYPISWIITSIMFIIYYLANKKYKLAQNNQNL